MDNRPIGFFDSGLGGLTCASYLMQALPLERIIYFGDTARTPYGSKALSTIRNFSFEISDFLAGENVKAIVIACNTVSSTCLEDLRKRHPHIPIIGVISPAAHYVAENCTEDDHIGIIGTKVTIQSDAYRTKILSYNPTLNLYETPCPAFVPLIEEGIIQNEIMDLTIRYYLDHFISYNRINTLVLGCTHYPLIRQNITKLYPDLNIVDPSEVVLSGIQKTLEQTDSFAEESTGENIFYASDLSENFMMMINRILQIRGFTVSFKNFDLEGKKNEL
ncbi:MAG: glutamate racemase [Clostridiales Family XIII bacterium]|jgi:glutamate racemase|nr:glutamate racemase [Clostridiales Family XIII bacterium]